MVRISIYKFQRHRCEKMRFKNVKAFYIDVEHNVRIYTNRLKKSMWHSGSSAWNESKIPRYECVHSKTNAGPMRISNFYFANVKDSLLKPGELLELDELTTFKCGNDIEWTIDRNDIPIMAHTPHYGQYAEGFLSILLSQMIDYDKVFSLQQAYFYDHLIAVAKKNPQFKNCIMVISK